MPAGSDPGSGSTGPQPATPGLPVRFRPLGVRLAATFLGLGLVVTVVAVWLTLPQETQESFSLLQRTTVVVLLLMGLAVAHALARSRVDADERGLTVVNGYRTHRLQWSQVVAVTLRPGSPWAELDLSDGTTRSAMGIQGSDGVRARRQARQLRALVDDHAAAEPGS